MIERTADGRFHPYVLDFGLARETANSDHSRTGVIEGTPRFMSPEQARGDTKHLDRRTDVYALGVTLYEILVRQSPYQVSGDVDILLAVLTRDPIPLRAVQRNIPIDLEAITLKCLEKEPAARYDSAKALADDLGRYLDGEPVEARHIGLTQRLIRRARRHKAVVALGVALLFTLLGGIAYGVRTGIQSQRRERQARAQAAITQRLGQEIKDMEWLLRSARQLPLHDLEHEKIIVRKRMEQLQAELLSTGALGRGLAHYALGRGHLALHEYSQALTQLHQAIADGNQSADVYYTLGLVLGKHFEQVMEDARVSGGGDWAKKQLKENAPKYLIPAIAALKRSRDMKLDAPEYLEGMIAWYQADEEAALKHAATALREAPWLYEAAKLAGDVHLQRGLRAKDGGRYDEADKEFALAVKNYQAASRVGPSDAEVYASEADAWIHWLQALPRLEKPINAAYAGALAAGKNASIAEPQSTVGALKQAFAANTALNYATTDADRAEQLKRCLESSTDVLQKQPDNPHARHRAAGCRFFVALFASDRSEDSRPLFREAINILEPAVRAYPKLLWATKDLGVIYDLLGGAMLLHGDIGAKEQLEKALYYSRAASDLDPSFTEAFALSIDIHANLVLTARSTAELNEMLTKTDADMEMCKKLNANHSDARMSYVIANARAAWRQLQAGEDPQPRLKITHDTVAHSHKIGGGIIDVEQYSALAEFVAASASVQAKQDPSPALTALRAALERCLAIKKKDAMCRTLAAKAEWLSADWQALQKRSPIPSLNRALKLASTATQSPENHPDAWQALAETELRLAAAEPKQARVRDAHLEEGLRTIEKAFVANSNHALGQATRGALCLLRAKTTAQPEIRRTAAKSAVADLEQAVRKDPFLTSSYAPKLAQAKELLAAP